MKKTLLLTTIIGAGFFLAGCNGAQTNPVASNNNFQNLVPLHNQTQVNQEEPTSPFQIDIVGDNDENFADYVEGEAKTVSFKVRKLLPSIQEYNLAAIAIPQGAVLTRSSDDPDTWNLTWTPSIGIVPPGRPFVRFSVELQANVSKTDDARLNNFVDQAKPFEITVTRTEAIPTIVGINRFQDTTNEGDTFAFSVEVKDPTSNSVPPTLYRFPYNQGPNLENYSADGSTYVLPDVHLPLQKLPNGDWQFNYIFSTKDRDLPLPLNNTASVNANATGISVCLNFQAVSAYNNANASAELPKCSMIKFISDAPEVLWDDVNDVTQLQADTNVTIKLFTVKSINQRGQVSVENLSTGFNTWPGNPQLNCSDLDADPTSRTCSLSWNIPCTKAVRKDYTFVIKATDTVGKMIKPVTAHHGFEVSTDSCPAPVPVVPAAKPVVATKPVVAKTATPAKPIVPASPAVPKANDAQTTKATSSKPSANNTQGGNS